MLIYSTISWKSRNQTISEQNNKKLKKKYFFLLIILVLLSIITIAYLKKDLLTIFEVQPNIERINIQNFQENPSEDLSTDDFNLEEFLNIEGFNAQNELQIDIRKCQYAIEGCVKYIRDSVIISEKEQRGRSEEARQILMDKIPVSLEAIEFILVNITFMQIILMENIENIIILNKIPEDRSLYIEKDKIISKNIEIKILEMNQNDKQILNNIIQEQTNLINEKIELILYNVLRNQETSVINMIHSITKKILKTFSKLENSTKEELQVLCKTIKERYSQWPEEKNIIDTNCYNNCIVKGISEIKNENDAKEVKLFIWKAFIISYCYHQEYPI